MYLFHQDNLPETLTEMNEHFIINTIYRYLEKKKISPPGIVNKLQDLPANIVEFIHKLSQLAFNGLQKNELVFTDDKIKRVYPKVHKIPGAINGFGLLQAVEHYPKKGVGRTISVNFLHFTMQEYLAAFHVSTLSSLEQSSLIKELFWDGQFSFMWLMYVGIVGVKSNTFAYLFDSNSHIYGDKRKCLHLFQCYFESKSDAEMPQAVSSVFTDGNITLDNITLLPHHISSLLFFMSTPSIHHDQLKVLSLSNCNLRDIGINSLFKYVIKNNEKLSTLEYVDLSENSSSPWRIYCTIIEHCCINSLTLFGDEGMKEYAKDITDSLQRNLRLKSLTMCKIGRTVTQLIESILVDNKNLKELNLSWGRKPDGTRIIKRQLESASYNNSGVCVNILYDGYHECLSKTISLSNKKINDDAAYVIAFGLYNNTKIEKLDLSYNDITIKGMKKLSELDISLEYVDLSGNKSYPWNVYCTVIRRCCVNHLTLYGDVGMKEYAKDISHNLQDSLKLKSLTICKIGSTGIQLIENAFVVFGVTLKELNLSWGSNAYGTKIIKRKLKPISHDNNEMFVNILYDGHHECLSKTINLCNKNIDDDAVYVIVFGLYSNPVIEKLDLSCNSITANGMSRLAELDISLDYVDLSGNSSSPWNVYCAVIRHCCVNSLTLCGDEGMEKYIKDITDSLQKNLKLKSLTLCKIGSIGTQLIESILVNNTTLKQLNLCWRRNPIGTKIINRQLKVVSHNNSGVCVNILYNGYHEFLSKTISLSNRNINDNAVYVIAFGLYNNKTVVKLDLSCNEITNDGAVAISNCLKRNNTLRTLNISNNNITDNGAVAFSHCLKYNNTLQTLNISRNKITDNGALAISHCLKYNKTLKRLYLSQNLMNFGGLMLAKFIKYVEYVDLSGNQSSPWDGYCAIIRHCCVNKLTLYGNEEIKHYVKEIVDSLQINTTLQSLTLCASRNGLSRYRDMVVESNSMKRPQLVVDGKLYFSIQVHDEEVTDKRVVNLKILYDKKCDSLTENVCLSSSNINDDAVCLITFGLYNNTTVKKLDLSCNRITYDGAVAIRDCLKYNKTLQTLDISHNMITGYEALAITECLQHNNTLKELNLSQNNINLRGMRDLSLYIRYSTSLEYVDLSENGASPWDVYCTIIRHCCVNSLTLCGDEGMKEYIMDITDSLQRNTILQSLTLCKIGKVGLQSIKTVLGNNTTLKELNLSWVGKGTMIIHRKPLCNEFNNTRLDLNSSHEGLTDINILYDGDHECTSEVISMSNQSIDDDAVYLVIFGLLNNVTVQKIDFGCNNITDDGAMELSRYLKCSYMLKEFNLSQNNVGFRGMNTLLDCWIKNSMPLTYVDLSGNRSSPWGVYCDIIRHCHVNSLSLCGDEGMKNYITEITDSLQTNEVLQSLTLCKIKRFGLQIIRDILDNNTFNKSLKELNLSWTNRGTVIIYRELSHSKLDSMRLGLNCPKKVLDINILYDGNHECASEAIIMSNLDINDDAVYIMSFGLCNNTIVQILDLSANNITDYGAIAISECLKTNNILQDLNLSDNQITSKGAEEIAEAIWLNKGLHKLNVSQNAICDDGVMYISDSIRNNNTLIELNLSRSGITDKGGKIISEAIQINTALQKLNLSHNNITDNVVIVMLKWAKRNKLRLLITNE